MWQTALAELELQMSGPTFDAWIRPTSLLSWEPNSNGDLSTRTRAVIGAPNAYIRDWLENGLIVPIQRTLSSVAGTAVEIRFGVCEHGEAQPVALLGDDCQSTASASRHRDPLRPTGRQASQGARI